MKLDWKTCFRIGASALALYLCIQLVPMAAELALLFIGAAGPLLVGCVIAYIVNILMSFYEKHYFPAGKSRWVRKSRRGLCMLGAYLTLLAAVMALVALVLPQLTLCVQILFAELPDFLSKSVSVLDQFHLLPENIIAILEDIDWRSRMGEIAQMLTSGLGSVVDVVFSALSSVFSWVVSALVGLIFSVYLLFGKERLGAQVRRLLRHYFKARCCDHFDYVVGVFNGSFHRYIVGQCTEACILGSLCALGMLALQLPYAGMIGALIGFTALIPIAGAYIGGGVGAFMILTVSPMKALVFLVFLVVLQQLEGNIIYPRVVGSSMGLPGIWVLAAVTVGGGVAGVLGMLLGVPLAAAFYQLLRNDVRGTAPIQLPRQKKE